MHEYLDSPGSVPGVFLAFVHIHAGIVLSDPLRYTRAPSPLWRGGNRPREGKVAQGHTAGRSWSWETNPGTLVKIPFSHCYSAQLWGSLHGFALLSLSDHMWVCLEYAQFTLHRPFPLPGMPPSPLSALLIHAWGLSLNVTASRKTCHCSGLLKPL